MPRLNLLAGLLASAAILATAASATAQPAKKPAQAPAAMMFPEIPHPPPPPGAPTMEQALAAYLGNRAPAAGADSAPRPPPAPPPGRTLPPILTIGPVPDQTHSMFTLPEDMPWQGTVGRNQTINLFGDPTKPGPYIQLMKWWPGAYSGPHMHPNTRNEYVVSGTWWVSTSSVQDKTQTYPLPAGTFVQQPGYTVHWDGARNEPAVIMIWGNGPSPNIAVDETGKVRLAPPAAGTGPARQ
jgi:quercetin dioxygenase-like cupin family protein